MPHKILFALLAFGIVGELTAEFDEAAAKVYIEGIEEELVAVNYKAAEASWAYQSDLSDKNDKFNKQVQLESAEFSNKIAKELHKYSWRDFKDEDLKRKIKKLADLGDSILPLDKFKQLQDTLSNMQSNYAKVKICSFEDNTKCNLSIEPDMLEIFAKSRNADELKYYWLQWYNLAGTKVKADFVKYVELKNEAAKMNNFSSTAEHWLDAYEDSTFEVQLESIMDKIMPLYKQLHAYVRYKLLQKYGPTVIDITKPIPMHLLSNVWAQSWDLIADLILPYPEVKSLDVTDEMVKQEYTPLSMFQKGDDFFQSINMTALPKSFYEKSILIKPEGKELVCHASAWDFYIKGDVRIKQCTRVNMDQFFVVHHELGHIQYYLQYQDQPYVYRTGANPGFHEAVGDVLSLSVSTERHLSKIGLLKDYTYDEKAQLNQLVRMGLAKLAFVPFAYTMDKFRWALFRGEYKVEESNCKFWEMREKYSGIEPPVKRTNLDFDPPAKYHLSSDVEYLRYFVSYITQFQFYKAACIKAGQYLPNDPEKTLNNCDIHGSTEAGNAFKAMLSLGASKPWPIAMEVMTGQKTMDPSAFLEYFKPLEDWLVQKNKNLDIHVGWTPSDKYSCL